tara:strand:- start:858 stop:1928 length:1071 start_codon:yes stop_codon:yes gene_type:complete
VKTEIRELRPGDMDSFAELTASRDNLTRKESDARAEVVEWVAFRNPTRDDSPHYFVGVQGERVVAHLGRMPTLFQIGGTREMASYFHDLYVHPELRHQGGQGFFLSMKMYRKCEKASKSFSAMIWTNEINISLQKARKYKQMWTDKRVMILGLKQKIEKRVSGSVAVPAVKAARAFIGAGIWANGLRLRTKAKLERIDQFDSRFDVLSDRAAASIGICPYKSGEYLNWKYANRPHLDYAAFQLLDEAGQLGGFCVVINPDNTQTGSIAELMVVDNDRAGIHALLERAVRHLESAGAERIEAVATSTIYSQALHDRLFRRVMRVPLFLAKADASQHKSLLLSPSNWHMGLGDSEGPF